RRRRDDRPLGTFPGPRDRVRRRKGDADAEQVRILGRHIRSRPVLGTPFLERLRGVVGVDLKESVRGEDVRGDLIAVAVEREQVRATERRQQHREVEVERPFLTVKGLVVEPALLDLTCAFESALTPRSLKSDSVQSWL